MTPTTVADKDRTIDTDVRITLFGRFAPLSAYIPGGGVSGVSGGSSSSGASSAANITSTTNNNTTATTTIINGATIRFPVSSVSSKEAVVLGTVDPFTLPTTAVNVSIL